MMIPGSAPFLPASKDPARLTTLPFSNSAVSSPMYQTLPVESWAYQSTVSSTICPPFWAVSRTTRAVMPFASFLVAVVATTTTSCVLPFSSTSRYVHRVPGFIGQYGLVMSALKFAGSSVTGSAPVGSLAAGGLDSGLDAAATGPGALVDVGAFGLLVQPAQTSVAASASGAA